MSYLKSNKNRLSLLVILSIGIALLIALPKVSPTAKAQFDPVGELNQIVETSDDVFAGIRMTLKDLVATGGIPGAFEVIRLAFVSDNIGIYQCHTLNHLLGHHAVIEYEEDVDAIVAYDTTFCELGYRHGVEGQIATEDGTYRERQYAYCDVLRAKYPGKTCFHGAGHSFMNESLNLDTALGLCEQYSERGYEHINECYLGVFAEYTNLVGGVDGETGQPYEGEPPLPFEGTPIDYCATLKDEYQVACVRELSGLGNGLGAPASSIDDSLRKCVNNTHAPELQDACLFSVSALRAQHQVAEEGTVLLMPVVLEFSPVQRRSYIRGAAAEMYQYNISGNLPDWESFCNSFTDTNDIEYCARVVEFGS